MESDGGKKNEEVKVGGDSAQTSGTASSLGDGSGTAPPKPQHSKESAPEVPTPIQPTDAAKTDSSTKDDKALPAAPVAPVEPKQSTKGPEKKIGFRSLFHSPGGAYFLLGFKFAERFAYYGISSILVMYFTSIYGSSDTGISKLIFHLFKSVNYFMPVVGSVLADGFFGRYRVILIGSIVYCLGTILLTIGAVPSLGQTAMLAIYYTGLFTIGIFVGIIGPCVSAFAGDQFPPDMEGERNQYFSFFYFTVNVGALLTIIITPILRRQPCLGQATCYPLAFGIPSAFMLIALVIFGCGTPWYKIVRTTENIIWKVCKCIGYALKQRYRSKEKKPHWLDHAIPKYEPSLVDDIKNTFGIMLLFLPVVLFWALFDQQGSTWVLQAAQMNGRIGQLTILPDQMSAINPFLIIILIPLFEGFVYPCLAKCNIWTRPLRRMGWGGVLAAISFVAAGFLQLAVDSTDVKLPAKGQNRLHVASFVSSDIVVMGNGGHGNFSVPAGETKSGDLVPNATIIVPPEFEVYLNASDALAGYVVAVFEDQDPQSPLPSVQYKLEKTPDGETAMYFLFEPSTSSNLSISVELDGEVKGSVHYNGSVYYENNGSVYFNFSDSRVGTIRLVPAVLGSNKHDIFLKRCPPEEACPKTALFKSFASETGAAHVLIVTQNGTARLVEVVGPNTIPILWQVPQFVLITIGETLLSVSGLAFAYSQASPKMKSVFQAIWLLTVSFGNLISMGLSGGGLFKGLPALEFFVYAALMGVVMVFFALLAWRYKFKKTDEEPEPSKK